MPFIQYGEILFPAVTWLGMALNLALIPLFAVLASIILYHRYVRGEEIAS